MTSAASDLCGVTAGVVGQSAAEAGDLIRLELTDGAQCPGLSDHRRKIFGTIEFDISFKDDRLEPAQRHDFKHDFIVEAARLEAWTNEHGWVPPPAPDFKVIVSDRYRISKSLVPAWSGHRGRMEFPAWRVSARNAAILHELVHVLFPNGNRLLAEGLAIYLQAEIGSNPAFPNFGRPLHDLARERMRAMMSHFAPDQPAGLPPLQLAELDAIATPSPLTLQIGSDHYGEEPRGQAHIYPIAGSFVQFLIESRGLSAFRKLYDLTPLVPQQQKAGSPGRWADVYGVQLVDLESEWKSLVAAADQADGRVRTYSTVESHNA